MSFVHCSGLYLGYLKARSTVASMKVICSREYPNVLPHHKIRENPNISQYVCVWGRGEGGRGLCCSSVGAHIGDTVMHSCMHDKSNFKTTKQSKSNQINSPEEVFFSKEKLAASGGIRTHDTLLSRPRMYNVHVEPEVGEAQRLVAHRSCVFPAGGS